MSGEPEDDRGSRVGEDPVDARPSKSAIKREFKDLQKLAARMAEQLSDGELARLGISAGARRAVAELRRMPSSGARQRQIKYTGRLLADEDCSPVTLYLENRKAAQLEVNRRFHALERWRDRLIGEGDAALSALVDEYPDLDRQQLRQLVRAAQAERDAGKAPAAARRLFRFLREQVPMA